MTRREFITLLGGAAAAWPLAARAQQASKLPTIGFLGSSTLSEASPWVSAFVERLRELGWTEGRNVAMAFRWAGGRSERYSEIATEFVGLKVDVIVTFGTPAALATKQATAAVPIVIALAGDPVGAGLVASLARPGGNITGLSSQSPDLTGKRLALLREVVPNLRRLAIMANVASPTGLLEMGESQAAARALGLEIVPLEIRRLRTLHPPSSRSRVMRMRFMSFSTRSRIPTEFASIRSRSARGCRRCSGIGTPPERPV
jgi:putative ABC transport system substrate-binding protein